MVKEKLKFSQMRNIKNASCYEYKSPQKKEEASACLQFFKSQKNLK